MKRYENYASALQVLSKAPFQDLSNEFVQGGIIDKFALQFELGWKLLKWVLSYEGDARAASGSPREIIKAAYGYFDFINEDTWLAMLRDRNNTAHIYDGDAINQLIEVIINRYIPEFERLQDALLSRYGALLTA